MKRIFKSPKIIVSSSIGVIFAFVILSLWLFSYGKTSLYLPSVRLSTSSLTEPSALVQINLSVQPLSSIQLPINTLDEIVQNPASFIKLKDGKVVASPLKSDVGEYRYLLTYEPPTEIILTVANNPVNYASMLKEIENYLGSDVDHFGIYVEDLTSGTGATLNATKIFPSASISKLPSVALVLRDIDAGKLSFDTPVKVRNINKHSNLDTIGRNPEGTLLPLKLFIDTAILESNNSAHYHLHNDVLGGKTNVLNRSRGELGLRKFSLDPLEATASQVGQFLSDLYRHRILSPENSKYLINLMLNAYGSLKVAIPAGLPADVKVANKVGFLFGGAYGNTYSDAAIVFGKKTDYILVVLNDQAPPYPNGKYRIQQISQIVYKYME